jgi:hypothetical protein
VVSLALYHRPLAQSFGWKMEKWVLDLAGRRSKMKGAVMKSDNTLRWLVVLTVLSVLLFPGSHHAHAQDATHTGADELYRNMYEGGLLTEEDYQYALREGHLPGGDGVAAITSALGEEEEARAQHRGLTYSARREAQRQHLGALAASLHDTFDTRRTEARSLARSLDLPLRQEASDGKVIELVAFDHGGPMYHVTHNLNAADTISSDEVWPSAGSGLALDGRDVTLGIWDAGAVAGGHVEFLENWVSRVDQKDSPAYTHYHATAVAGTMIATGWQAAAKGMASVADLDAYDWNDNLAELASASASNDLRVSNHSYGLVTGWYSNETEHIWEWYGDLNISTNDFGQVSFGECDPLHHPITNR